MKLRLKIWLFILQAVISVLFTAAIELSDKKLFPIFINKRRKDFKTQHKPSQSQFVGHFFTGRQLGAGPKFSWGSHRKS